MSVRYRVSVMQTTALGGLGPIEEVYLPTYEEAHAVVRMMVSNAKMVELMQNGQPSGVWTLAGTRNKRARTIFIRRIAAVCAHEGCNENAIKRVPESRFGEVKDYCQAHADLHVEDGGPEYKTSCPDCGCRFGVN